MKLEGITSGLSLSGIEPAHIVTVVAAVPIAEGALQLVYKTPDGAFLDGLMRTTSLSR